MANPPSPSVVEILDIPIARPRDRVSIVDHPAFRTSQEKLMALLTADAA